MAATPPTFSFLYQGSYGSSRMDKKRLEHNVNGKS